MKHYLKNYLKLGILLFGISFLLLNCQKVDDLTTSPRNIQNAYSKYEISRINLNDILRKGHLTNGTSKPKSIKNKKASDNLKLYTSNTGFQIDTDYATYIESTDGLYHSYTFPIIYEIEKDSLDNLLISLQPDGTYSAFKVQYGTTAQEKEDLKGGIEVDLSGKVTYSPIDDDEFILEILNDKGLNPTITYKESYAECSDVSALYCTCGEHDIYTGFNGEDGDEPCQCLETVFLYTFCSGGSDFPDNTDDSNNPTNNGDSNTNSGNTTSGGTPNIGSSPDTTSPTPEPPTAWEQIETCINSPTEFTDNSVLTNEMLVWLQLQENKPIANTIKDFLVQNNCSDEAQEIIIKVLEIECETVGNENSWTNNLEDNEEPKWGQLANKQEILDEISNISGLYTLTYEQQIAVLANHFQYNLMYDRDDNNNGALVQIINLDSNALNYFSNDDNSDLLPISRDVNRYVYSEVGGWIDFHHVFKVFEWANQHGPFLGIVGGDMGELIQSVKDNESAYSYEDLPSNLLA